MGLKAVEKQLTSGDANCLLTNANVWSRDGHWIYYDVRSDTAGTNFDGTRIERVHVNTGLVECVFEAKHSACVGVVTVSPMDDKIVFIHGPEHSTDDWRYAAWRRRGVMLTPGQLETATDLDACNLDEPFTPGALRGGSHVHVFSGDGRWVSFTYEDQVLAMTQNPHAQKNQRNVGVSVPLGPVIVPRSHPRNHDGAMFSVIVTKTSDAPARGSDEISRAYEDAWIGIDGYARGDETKQHRSLAFIGDTVSAAGAIVPELFVVDLPEDSSRLAIAGETPLCGTPTLRPAPPRDCRQRRLTHTHERAFPGLAKVRHWPRSSPDGSMIAALIPDEFGHTQLWLVSPLGDTPRQLTSGQLTSGQAVQSAFTFRCDGNAIACVIGGRVCEVDSRNGDTTPISLAKSDDERPRPEAVVYSPDGTQVAFVRRVDSKVGIRNQIFIARTTC